jgi:hypothetical protein
MRIIGLLFALLLWVSSPIAAMAGELRYCHAFIETMGYEDSVPHCRPGDTLVLQIVPDVAPGQIVGRFCDLKHEVWTEALDRQVTIVCQYVKKKQRTVE